MARDTLFKNKAFSFLLRQVGAFPVKRESSDTKAIKEALKRLKNQLPVVLFPEGTRLSSQKKIQPGVGLIAVKSGVPVIPAFIDGPDKVLPPGARFFQRHPVIVVMGKPRIYSREDSYQHIAEEIVQDIYSMANRAVSQGGKADRSRLR